MQLFIETKKIDNDSFEEALREALHQMANFSMSGWGVALYLEDDGTVSVSDPMSQGTWQPDALELCRIEAFELEEEYKPVEGEYSEREAVEDIFIEYARDYWKERIQEQDYSERYVFEFVDNPQLIFVSVEDETVTINGETCNFREAGLYENGGDFSPLKNKDDITEHLEETNGNDVIIIFK